jgi:ceramide glucosyltransferase
MLNPFGYAGSVITHPLPLAILAAALSGSAYMAAGFIGMALFSRFLLRLRVRAAVEAKAGPLWLLPVRDMMSFAVYLASFFGNSVYWRGNRYVTRTDGVLAQR